MKFSHYAVIQTGYCIFGTGVTEDDALENAREWVDDAENLESQIVDNYQAVDGDLIVVECTEALHDLVQESGTCTFENVSKTEICLPEECAEDDE